MELKDKIALAQKYTKKVDKKAKSDVEKAHYLVLFSQGFTDFKENFYAYVAKDGDIG
jgi:hypothetical protein